MRGRGAVTEGKGGVEELQNAVGWGRGPCCGRRSLRTRASTTAYGRGWLWVLAAYGTDGHCAP